MGTLNGLGGAHRGRRTLVRGKKASKGSSGVEPLAEVRRCRCAFELADDLDADVTVATLILA